MTWHQPTIVSNTFHISSCASFGVHSVPTAPLPPTISPFKLLCPSPLSSVTVSLSLSLETVADYACTLTYSRTMRKFSFTSVVPTTLIIFYLTPDSVVQKDQKKQALMLSKRGHFLLSKALSHVIMLIPQIYNKTLDREFQPLPLFYT